MIEVAMHNKHCAAFTCLLRQPEIMHHDLVITRVDVPLMVGNVRVLHPEIQTVKAAVGDHFGRIEGFEPVQKRVPVPIRYFYGICFPVHVELNACHE